MHGLFGSGMAGCDAIYILHLGLQCSSSNLALKGLASGTRYSRENNGDTQPNDQIVPEVVYEP